MRRDSFPPDPSRRPRRGAPRQRGHAWLLASLALAAASGLRPAAQEPAPAPPPAPQTSPSGTPTHEATDFRLTVSREGKDLFSLRARRSASFGHSHTDLEEVSLEARAGPAPGLQVRARRGRYYLQSGDFDLEGRVRVVSAAGFEARLELLKYRAEEGVARSSDIVELSDQHLRGSARGLEVDPVRGRLSLLAEVALHYEEGRRPRQAELRCGRLDYHPSPPRLNCLEGALATARDRRLQAGSLQLDLREVDRRPLFARAEGEASLSLQLEPPQGALLGSQFRGFPSGSALTLSGERIELEFEPERGDVRALEAPRGGALAMRPLDGSDARRDLSAAWLKLWLRKERRGGKSLPESLEARSQVEVSWSDPDGAGRLRTEQLAARWSEDASRIDSARLAGHWSLERADLRAAGAQADLDPGAIELRGDADAPAFVERAGRFLSAARLSVPRPEGTWRGEGGVQVRRSAEAAGSSWTPFHGDEEFWVSARSLEVEPEGWRWTFLEQVRAWQGSNLIEADELQVDESARTLAARGSVVTRGTSAARPGEPGVEVVWVRAPRLDYSEHTRLAEYRDGVEMIHDTSHLTARELDAWISDRAGGVERVAARGEVQVIYRDALGEAERAEYAPAGRRLRLWTPGGTARARRRDGSQSLSGQELVFEGSSERIAVQSGTRGRSWVLFHHAP